MFRLPFSGRRRTTAIAESIIGLASLVSEPAWAQADNLLLPRNLSPWGMFLHADVVVKAVMIGLTIASLVTWTVWLAKTIELRLATRRVRRRLQTLESGDGLLAAARVGAFLRQSNLDLIAAARSVNRAGPVRIGL